MRDIKAEAEAIRQLDPKRYSETEASKIMQSFLQEYTTAPNKLFMPTTYRVRINNGQELFDSKQDLWAPPAHIAGRGRFNKAGEAVLYVSATYLAAIWEMRPTPGTWMTVLAARQRHDSKPLILAPIGLEYIRDNDKTGPVSKLFSGGVRAVSFFQEHLEKRGIERQWRDQDDFVAELAIKQFDDDLKFDSYNFTVPIRDHFVKAGNPFSGLLYPSVECDRYAVNIALQLEAAECIECIEAWVVEIRDVFDPQQEGDEKTFDGPVIHRGFFDSEDKIVWGSRGEWSLDFVHRDFLSRLKAPPSFEGLTPMLKKPGTKVPL